MNYVSSGYVRTGYSRKDSDTQTSYTFDPVGKSIYIDEQTSSINLADLYSRWVDWLVIDDNLKWEQAMRYTGFDIIPGGYTGATFFVTNGWKVVYNTSTTAISGVLYSDTYSTGYFNTNGDPIYPVTVSGVVNTVSVGSGLSASESDTLNNIVRDVWAAASRTLTESIESSALHDALDSYNNKDTWKADVSGITVSGIDIDPEDIWTYPDRTLTSGDTGSSGSVDVSKGTLIL